ncbi:TonB-linked SusC/RagA family outer membrane protein [Arcticibacter pallidicorallinus]|uniref:TonB-linked SusC/RagA family outer membrane protein n=1 Tax=Arcticibacter pallidicorallinus TaxID=1259464 RepID=A0A2T0U5H3_9SPHI|nr:TonB-dependent receptor [Arcticibacter pallidicorallinus]PRY53173.1 TonB-linked SusC/RagA family outer membrane protein [Arcticibacter pallidicorallinus]
MLKLKPSSGAFIAFFIVAISMLYPRQTMAQGNQTTVTGTVSDTSGVLPGVSVKVKGTSIGTMTDAQGRYRISSPSTATLEFTSIGFTGQEIAVRGRTVINVQLKADQRALDEVVVIGYGTQKKVDLTSSIATVETKDLLKVPGGFQAALQSTVPGVQVNAGTIRIRGVGSINNTDPLYVVDGMIGGAVPDDNNIASIQILKDAASSAIYGSRGANGVILITTKRGTSGPVKIDYFGYGGTKTIANNVETLNGQQLAELINEEMYNQNPSRTDYLPALSNPANIGEGYNMVDALLRTGSYQKHNLSLSGGSENANFRINGIYSTDKPILIRDNSKSYGTQFISDFTKGKLKVGETVLLSFNKRTWSDKNLIDAQRWSSTLPLYDPNSSTGFAGAGNGTDVASALANAYLNENNSESFFANGNIWASYEIIPGLKYKFNLGLDLNRYRDDRYISAYSVGQYQNHDPDELNISSNQNNRWLFEHTLSYDKMVGKHSFSALAGITSEESRFKSVNAGARALPSPDLMILGLSTMSSSRIVGSGIGQFAMYSMLGRLNYSYDSKYLMTLNFRRDGSANFSKTHRYGNFPSVSAGWRVSQENFMKNVTFINDLKLRGSYGLLGNSDIAQYQYQRTVSFDHVWYYLNGVMVTGALPLTPSNPNVKWESQYSTDLGVDLSMFGNKLSLTVDYYDKKTEDMLVNVPISYVAGYIDNFPVLNSGSLRNRGWDMLATYRNSIRNFSYSASANLSLVDNEVLSLGNDNEILFGNVNPGGENVTRTAVGQSIGEFWGYVSNGLYTTQEQLQQDRAFAPRAGLGDVRFNDLNGDNVLNDRDKAFIGSPIPDFSYGFNFDASYAARFGTLDFSMIWQGVQGNEIYNNSKYWGEGMYHYYNNFATTLDRYRAEEVVFTNPVSGARTVYPKNVNTNVPRAILGDPNQNLRASSRFIEDGSYLRLKSLNLGYSLPEDVTRRMKIDRLRVYVGAKNLLTFTKYSGYDPEVGSDDARYNLSRGIDAQRPWGRTFPNSKEFFLGAQFTF